MSCIWIYRKKWNFLIVTISMTSEPGPKDYCTHWSIVWMRKSSVSLHIQVIKLQLHTGSLFVQELSLSLCPLWPSDCWRRGYVFLNINKQSSCMITYLRLIWCSLNLAQEYMMINLWNSKNVKMYPPVGFVTISTILIATKTDCLWRNNTAGWGHITTV